MTRPILTGSGLDLYFEWDQKLKTVTFKRRLEASYGKQKLEILVPAGSAFKEGLPIVIQPWHDQQELRRVDVSTATFSDHAYRIAGGALDALIGDGLAADEKLAYAVTHYLQYLASRNKICSEPMQLHLTATVDGVKVVSKARLTVHVSLAPE